MLKKIKKVMTRKIRVHKAITILGFLAMSYPVGNIAIHGAKAGMAALQIQRAQDVEQEIERAKACLNMYEVDGDKKQLERAKVIILNIENDIFLLNPAIRAQIKDDKIEIPNLKLVKIKLDELKEIIASLEK